MRPLQPLRNLASRERSTPRLRTLPTLGYEKVLTSANGGTVAAPPVHPGGGSDGPKNATGRNSTLSWIVFWYAAADTKKGPLCADQPISSASSDSRWRS